MKKTITVVLLCLLTMGLVVSGVNIQNKKDKIDVKETTLGFINEYKNLGYSVYLMDYDAYKSSFIVVKQNNSGTTELQYHHIDNVTYEIVTHIQSISSNLKSLNYEQEFSQDVCTGKTTLLKYNYKENSLLKTYQARSLEEKNRFVASKDNFGKDSTIGQLEYKYCSSK